MKALLLSALLVLSISPTWAQESTEKVAEAENAVHIQIGGDNEGSEAERQAKREKIIQVLDKITTKVNTALDDDVIVMDDAKRLEVAEAILEASEEEGNDNRSNDDGSSWGVLVPIFAVLLIFGSPLIIVALVLRSSSRKRQLMHDTISKYIDSGQPVPDSVINSMQTPAKSQLQSGMLTLAIGLGLGVASMIAGWDSMAAISVIFLFIGAARLVIWKLEDKNSSAV